MSKEKQIEIPENEMGMSGYSQYSWKLYLTGEISMAQAELADRIMREEGYRKQSEGEWLCADNGFGDIYCSVCGCIGPVDCEKEEFYKSDFCPSCGAKMKGGAE